MRLGDLDALKRAACVKFYTTPYYKHILDLIDNAPTVDMNTELSVAYLKGRRQGQSDVRPQGEWIRKVDEVGFISHICSECGAEIEVEDPKDDKVCFNCGADMRKGGNE